MEANRQSLISRGACILVAAMAVVPCIQYDGGMEPTRKAFVQLLIKSLNGEHPPYLMVVWLVPSILAVLRLAGMFYNAHVFLAAGAILFAIIEFFLSWVGPGGGVTFAHLQVYFGLEGVAPALHYGLHAAGCGGFAAVWFFDELRAQQIFKPMDAKD